MHKSEGSNSGELFSSSAIWVRRLELRWLGLAASVLAGCAAISPALNSICLTSPTSGLLPKSPDPDSAAAPSGSWQLTVDSAFLIFSLKVLQRSECVPVPSKTAWQRDENFPCWDFYLSSDSVNSILKSEPGWRENMKYFNMWKANQSGQAWILTLSQSSSNVQSATVPQALFSPSALPCTFRILGLVTMGTWTKTQSCLDNYYKIHLLQIGNA